MIITKSNILLGTTPSVTTGSSSDDPVNIVDPDFSTLYTSSSNSTLTISFGVTQSINYVAVAGINIGTGSYASSITVKNGSSTIKSNQVQRNNCVVIDFEERSFSNLVVTITNAAASRPPLVRFVAAGEAFTVPNDGENAGYNRQFLNRNIQSKSTLTDISAPINYLTKKISAKGTLSLQNLSKEFTEEEWQDFLDFATSNYFFIREQDLDGDTTQNSSAYLCYDLTANRVTAHAQTRALNNASISFKVFNGL